jgi:hypothetical protein
MTAADLTARIRRLEKLVMSLMVEQHLVRKAEDPLLYAERREYLRAVNVATTALDEAKVVLARVLQRLEKDDG